MSNPRTYYFNSPYTISPALVINNNAGAAAADGSSDHMFAFVPYVQAATVLRPMEGVDGQPRQLYRAAQLCHTVRESDGTTPETLVYPTNPSF
jgi:hypothetical protein